MDVIEMNSKRPVFRVLYECKNCGAKWKREYPKGTRVILCWTGVYVKRNSCVSRICDCCDYAECPICGLKEDVRIVKREPI